MKTGQLKKSHPVQIVNEICGTFEETRSTQDPPAANAAATQFIRNIYYNNFIQKASATNANKKNTSKRWL